MMQSTFRESLKRAWSITIHNPRLWILGFFATLSIDTGIYQNATRNAVTLLRDRNLLQEIGAFYEKNSALKILDISAYLPQIDPSKQLLYFAIVTGGILFFIYLSVISEIAIISSTESLFRGKSVTVSSSLTSAHRHFGQTLVITILSRVSYLLLFVITSVPLYLSIVVGNPLAIAISAIAFFILFIPIGILISFLALYAINYTILERRSLGHCIMDSWKLFVRNKLVSVETALLMIIIKLVSLLITISIAGIIFIPLALFTFSFVAAQQSAMFGLMLSLGVIITLATYIFINSVFTVFYLSSWTMLFESVTQKSVVSKLIRTVNALFGGFSLSGSQKKALAQTSSRMKYVGGKMVKKVEQKYQEASPSVMHMLEEMAEKYEEQKPVIQTLQKDVISAVKREHKNLIPTLRKVERNVISGIKVATPIVKKSIVKLAKDTGAKHPAWGRFVKDLQDKYRSELERDLEMILGSAKKKKKAPLKIKKAAKKKSNKKIKAKNKSKR